MYARLLKSLKLSYLGAMSRKLIIVFEGIEGSGKSHHISIVSKYLKKKKISHLKIREPGGNPNSEKIRKLILNKKSRF